MSSNGYWGGNTFSTYEYMSILQLYFFTIVKQLNWKKMVKHFLHNRIAIELERFGKTWKNKRK